MFIIIAYIVLLFLNLYYYKLLQYSNANTTFIFLSVNIKFCIHLVILLNVMLVHLNQITPYYLSNFKVHLQQKDFKVPGRTLLIQKVKNFQCKIAESFKLAERKMVEREKALSSRCWDMWGNWVWVWKLKFYGMRLQWAPCDKWCVLATS